MKVTVELAEADIRRVLADYINEHFSVRLTPEEVEIQVKSKQNYKSEWEKANIRINLTVIR